MHPFIRSVEASTAVCLSVSIAAATPSYADIKTFAEFHQITTVKGVHWIRTQVRASNSRARLEGGRLFTKNSGSASIGDPAIEIPTSFSFLDPYLTTALNEGAGLLAGFKLDAFITPSTAGTFVDGDGNRTAENLSGSFDFIYRGSTPISNGKTTISSGGVLLHAEFSDAAVRGRLGGSTIFVDDSTFTSLSHNITYSSPFLDFTNSTPDPGHVIAGRNFVFGLSSIASPGVGIGPGTTCTVGVGPCAKLFNSFNATISGNEGSDPAPQSFVPEPATWSLMIIGFGAVGRMMRRRRPVHRLEGPFGAGGPCPAR